VGGLGSAVFILEGIQQLFQFHNHWNDFRSTCEDLKHEKYLFLAKAGPYSKGKNTNAIFAERVEALTSKEHSKWVGSQKAVATAKIRRG
jgi:hypothetical protein